MISQPSPELLTAVGHAILRSVAAGHSGPLQAAAGALDRLGRLLPNASPEGRMVAVLMAISSEPTPQAAPTDQSVDAVPPPARGGRQGQAIKAGKTSRTGRLARKGKPASQPILDAAGRLQPSRRIGDVDVVAQSTARQALGVSCSQMLKLEDQRLLTRIQETGFRHVWYPTQQVQRLLDLIDRGVAEPRPSQDSDAMA
jgi:hypothetical protein